MRHKSKDGAEKRKGEGDNAGARYGMRAAQATNSRAFAWRGVAVAAVPHRTYECLEHA